MARYPNQPEGPDQPDKHESVRFISQGGERGRQGDQGKQGAEGNGLKPVQIMVGFLTITCIFLFLAFRSETNANNIKDTNTDLANAVYDQCIVSANNASSVNKTIDQIIKSVSNRPDTDPEKQSVLAIYANAKANVIDCNRYRPK